MLLCYMNNKLVNLVTFYTYFIKPTEMMKVAIEFAS